MESSYLDSIERKHVEGTKITGTKNQRLKLDEDKLEDLCRKSEPLYSDDANKLTQFLPEEIWRFVLTKLKRNSLENAVNSSPFFRELRLNDRIIYLFPKVIDIMTPLFEKRKFQMKICNKTEQEIEKEFAIGRTLNGDEIKESKEGTAAAKLWRSTVFNCRLVCFAWNKAVEKCYERAEMAGIKQLVKDLDPRSPLNTVNIEIIWRTFYFSSEARRPLTKKLMEHFEESHGHSKNPFFGRSANIKLTRDLNDEYFNSFIQMLELFGREIWYCKLTVSSSNIVLELQRILNLMPNLKYLKVIYNGGYPPRKKYNPGYLPIMENLQVLSLDFVKKPLATELIRVNGHVQFLELYCCEIDENVGTVLGNLRGYSRYNSIGGDGILGRFGHNWKLTSVKVCSRLSPEAVQLFPLMQNSWAETLTDLSLEHPFKKWEDMVYEQSKSSRLNLPCVRRLCILSEHIFFLDFLEPMNKNLEHLEIFPKSFHNGAKYWEMVKCEQKIEWVGFKAEMNRSNIWNKFGKLKTVKIIFDSYRVSRRKEMVFTNKGEKLVYFL